MSESVLTVEEIFAMVLKHHRLWSRYKREFRSYDTQVTTGNIFNKTTSICQIGMWDGNSSYDKVFHTWKSLKQKYNIPNNQPIDTEKLLKIKKTNDSGELNFLMSKLNLTDHKTKVFDILTELYYCDCCKKKMMGGFIR